MLADGLLAGGVLLVLLLAACAGGNGAGRYGAAAEKLSA